MADSAAESRRRTFSSQQQSHHKATDSSNSTEEIVTERRRGQDGNITSHRYLKGKLLGKMSKRFFYAFNYSYVRVLW